MQKNTVNTHWIKYEKFKKCFNGYIQLLLMQAMLPGPTTQVKDG